MRPLLAMLMTGCCGLLSDLPEASPWRPCVVAAAGAWTDAGLPLRSEPAVSVRVGDPGLGLDERTSITNCRCTVTVREGLDPATQCRLVVHGTLHCLRDRSGLSGGPDAYHLDAEAWGPVQSKAKARVTP